jgi:hypothetical protein
MYYLIYCNAYSDFIYLLYCNAYSNGKGNSKGLFKLSKDRLKTSKIVINGIKAYIQGIYYNTIRNGAAKERGSAPAQARGTSTNERSEAWYT